MYQNSVAKPRLDLVGALRTQDNTGDAIAHLLLPPFKVDKKAATIPKLLTTNGQVFDIKHAAKTAYKRVQATIGDDNYNCSEAAIEVPMSAEDYDVIGQDAAEAIATEQGKNIVLTARDAALAAVLTGTAGETTLAGKITQPASAENWTEAGSKPIDDIAAADSALTLRMGVGPRTLVISQLDFEALQTNDQIRAEWRRIVGQTDAGATSRRLRLEDLAAVLGVDKILVAARRYNSANPGQTAVWSYVWPANYALLIRSVTNPADLTEPVLGRMFTWDNANLGAEAELESVDAVQAIFVESYRDETVKSDLIRVGEYTHMKLLNLDAAQMIKLPVSD